MQSKFKNFFVFIKGTPKSSGYLSLQAFYPFPILFKPVSFSSGFLFRTNDFLGCNLEAEIREAFNYVFRASFSSGKKRGRESKGKMW